MSVCLVWLAVISKTFLALPRGDRFGCPLLVVLLSCRLDWMKGVCSIVFLEGFFKGLEAIRFRGHVREGF